MLNPTYRYIGIDFETTGLDIQKDVPIQIWIVEMNAQGQIIDSFESLIKPQKDIKELKNIVHFITKIEVAQLVFAPTIEEIVPQIQHFFWENVIIIGHNIAFDLAFLEKVYPDFLIHSSFDTFQLAQALIPYPPSFALEILMQHLEEKPLFLERKTKFWLSFSSNEGETSFHDAFYDTKSTLALFCYLISYLQQIQERYPMLQQFFAKSESTLTSLLPKKEKGLWIGDLLLPPLKKIAPTNTTLASFPYDIDIHTLQNTERYYVGNLPFKELLLSLLSNKKTILVFSTKPKLDIAKNILNEMGIKNIGFAREEQTISQELFTRFLNKHSFNQQELYFIIKYCSHLYLGYGILDLNSKGDYMVYNFIKDERQVIKYPLVLTTHHGLYALLDKEEHSYADFDIVFFDLERRYRNYNQYLSRTCDLYYIQNFVDMLLYKYNLLREEQLITDEKYQILSEFDTFFTMFLGVIRTDTKKIFTGRAEDSISINPIVTNPDFYQTNLLIPKVSSFQEPLQSLLHPADFHTLRKQIEHFLSICETIAKVQRKMWGQSDFYFLFSEETKFTNREEFKEIFYRNHIVFFSNHEQSYPHIVATEKQLPRGLPQVQTIGAIEATLLERSAEREISIFIISTVKEESRMIFEALQKMKFLEGYEFLAENITGGGGKNIYKANKKFAKIVIGGYNFLMMCYAQKVEFDEILIRNVRGAQSKLILDDIVRYAPKKLPHST